MSMDILSKYYPMWLNNCKESIRWIREDSDREAAERGRAPMTAEEKELRIAEYEKNIKKYEVLILQDQEGKGEQS